MSAIGSEYLKGPAAKWAEGLSNEALAVTLERIPYKGMRTDKWEQAAIIEAAKRLRQT